MLVPTLNSGTRFPVSLSLKRSKKSRFLQQSSFECVFCQKVVNFHFFVNNWTFKSLLFSQSNPKVYYFPSKNNSWAIKSLLFSQSIPKVYCFLNQFQKSTVFPVKIIPGQINGLLSLFRCDFFWWNTAALQLDSLYDSIFTDCSAAIPRSFLKNHLKTPVVESLFSDLKTIGGIWASLPLFDAILRL